MPYEAQMAQLARCAVRHHGNLKEVVFLSKNKNSLLVFSDGAVVGADSDASLKREYGTYADYREIAEQLGGTHPYSLLAFGYQGTGPTCFTAFLKTAGFNVSVTDIERISPPVRLSAGGSWTHGKHKSAQWSVEVEGQTLDEARSKLEPIDQRTTCVIREEILSDGSPTDLTEAVQARTDADALDTIRRRILAGSTVVSSHVRETTAEADEEILADTQPDASRLAQEKVKSWEAPYKTLVELRCVVEPRRGFLGMGRRSGRFLAKYRTTSREVHLAYRPPARIRVLYGPKKLTCNQCGNVMATTTEGVHYASGAPSPEAAILKLRCDACDITRFEKRWEIDGRWIEWEDDSDPTVV